MEEDRIRGILEKYWEGETSLEEEAALRDFFSSDVVDEDLQLYQPLFSYFKESGQMQMPGEIMPPKPGKTSIISLSWITRVAAVCLILMGFLFILKQQQSHLDTGYAMEDTYDDPELAYQEVKDALLFLSTKMNKGVNQANESLEKIEPLDNILN